MINKDRTKPFNELPLLPLAKDKYLDNEILRLLGDAKGRLGELKGIARLIPNQGMLINSVSLQEARASSEIENIYTTQDELYAAFSNDDPKSSPAKEILNYREATWSGIKSMEGRKEMSVDDVIQVYRIIKNATDGFRDPLRKTVIKKGGDSLTSGQVIYTPPRGTEIIEGKVDNLIDFMNNDDEDPLIKMCIGHGQFEAIHPFSDGNGRTGRIINVLYLTQTGYLELPILFLSKFILKNKDDYYYSIGGITQRGDWKTWLKYMLQAVISTSGTTINLINRLVEAEEYVKAKIKRDNNQIYSEDLLRLIFTQPYTTVKQMKNARIGSEKTCRKYLDLLSLEPLGIMEKLTISGKVFYSNKELITAFED